MRDAWRLGHNPNPKVAAAYAGLVAPHSNGQLDWTGEVRLLEDRLTEPLHWKQPKRIFVNSMSDLFHESVPDAWIARIFAVMASCGRHTFQILTKRPERMAAWFAHVTEQGPLANNLYRSALIDFYQRKDVDLSQPYQMPTLPTPELRYIYDVADAINPHAPFEERHRRVQGDGETGGYLQQKRRGDYHWRLWPLSNVWLGVSVENRAALSRLDTLMHVPAAVRFASLEPLLENLGDITPWLKPAYTSCQQPDSPALAALARAVASRHGVVLLDWVIVGGESGHNARPCNLAWLRSVVEQCQAAGVPCFVKQLGNNAWPDNRSVWPEEGRLTLRDRKGADPSEWPAWAQVQQFPEVRV